MVALVANGRRDLRILNLGCGTGWMSQRLADFGEVVSTDTSQDALEFCRQRRLTNLVRCDASALPFHSGHFDLVVAGDVIEHLDDETPALAGITGVLKPQGHALVTVPAYGFLWSGFDEFAGHRRRYSRSRLKRRLEDAGMAIVRLSNFNSILLPAIAMHRLFFRLTGKKPESGDFLPRVPAVVNALLTRLLKLEGVFMGFAGIPWGGSILCVASPRQGGEA
jgi:SAM-dependent methyltransferase